MTQDYIGTKRVTAWPQLNDAPPPMGGGEGYAVKYADGYQSWSPKEAFEAAYQPVTAMGLGGALHAVKAGHTVTRNCEEWNSRGLTWGPDGLHNPKLARPIDTTINEKGVALAAVMLMSKDIFADDWAIVE